MKTAEQKREWEQKMVSQMIALYCRKKHRRGRGLCESCAKLEEYARPVSYTHLDVYKRQVVMQKNQKNV